MKEKQISFQRNEKLLREERKKKNQLRDIRENVIQLRKYELRVYYHLGAVLNKEFGSPKKRLWGDGQLLRQIERELGISEKELCFMREVSAMYKNFEEFFACSRLPKSWMGVCRHLSDKKVRDGLQSCESSEYKNKEKGQLPNALSRIVTA